MSDLLPCPWCGEVPEIKDAGESASIECGNIDCPMYTVRAEESDDDCVMPPGWCRDRVIEAWNTRPTPWRPIAEAKLDGEYLLLASNKEGWVRRGVHCAAIQGGGFSYPEHWEDDGEGAVLNPTNFMEIPGLPEDHL